MDHLEYRLTYKGALFCLSIWLIACQASEQNSRPDFTKGDWVDLSYPFDDNTIYWPTDSLGFRLDTVFYGTTDQEYFYAAYGFSSAEHGGTHLDAPIHFGNGKNTVSEIPLRQLIGAAIVIDVSDKAALNRDYQISIEDFKVWEQANGPMPDSAIVLLRTGYGQHWPDRLSYLGTEAMGVQAVAQLHFPGLQPEAASWLAQERTIKAIGLDTPSIDFGQSSLFESHRILFNYNIPVFENLANLEKLPQEGLWVFALPMNIGGGSGAPLRAVAWIPGL